MEVANSDSQQKPWFAVRIRQLRISHNKTQRQVAQAIGVEESTYANAESSRHRRLRADKVVKLADLYELTADAAAELMRGWQALPESDYNKRNAKPWAERDAKRSKLKNHDGLAVSVIELATLLITNVETPGALCNCGFDDETHCELCTALRRVGLRGWTTREDVIEKLAAAQEKLEKPSNTGKGTAT